VPSHVFVYNFPYSYRYTRHKVRQQYAPNADLSPRRRLVHHLCLLFLEPLSDALAASHELADAPRHAACLTSDQRFSSKVVHARLEAVVDEVGEHLRDWGVSRFLETVVGEKTAIEVWDHEIDRNSEN
jgi:hypothetical protein